MATEVKIEKTASEYHRELAVKYFNSVWDLMEKKERTIEETDEMIHMAHASRHHWGIVGAPINLARGEWQVSRAYAVAGRAEPALYHAQRCLDICLEKGMGDFDLAFAYEALARGYKIAGNDVLKEENLQLAREASQNIAKKGDLEVLLADLATI
ncbi:hypothetical protein [Falsibacillus pallidus]|uniref:Tetratricopeptide repeat protein n=1 Tax=Falsibacillus pallidus TaxID=493781 RepID=A0A370GG29_9BACI|nr:hypothetical protein [Falsibacillus pallidus]RDI42270.1 hypothetical protein DFR59_105110 [Falsibacillus pallidus]